MKKPFFLINLLDGTPAVAKRGNPTQIVAIFRRGDDGIQQAEEYVAMQNDEIPPKIKAEIKAQSIVACKVQEAAIGILSASGLLSAAQTTTAK